MKSSWAVNYVAYIFLDQITQIEITCEISLNICSSSIS